MAEPITFERHPEAYRHWRLTIEPPLATLMLAVDPDGGLSDDYHLKQNSYDLAVDIELRDAVERLRFEHPEVHAVIITGALEKVFCAGANIQMLAGATHHHKVNFCKLTNETRFAIEDASTWSRQRYLAALNGTAAGGGYELALACDEIVLVDDRSSAVSLPEVPLLGVLPGTGGLTRLVDKRHVRRDRADVVATRAEGVRGRQAVEWRLVDDVVAPTRFATAVRERALAMAATSDRPDDGPGVELSPLSRRTDGDCVVYDHVRVDVDRVLAAARLTVAGPSRLPADLDGIVAEGARFWPLAAARELDDALLHLRFNEAEIATIVLRTEGDVDAVVAADRLLRDQAEHWLVREITLAWTRVLKRLDVTAKSLVALVEPGSCFVGVLAELLLAADRSFMLAGTFDGDGRPEPVVVLDDANRGRHPMANGLSRLATRFFGDPTALSSALAAFGRPLTTKEAADAGLVTFTPDELDWDDEVRLALEERAGFSPDALTAMEANLRFVGPETMETKVFGRLSAWQNWIFQRPNAVGPDGALRRYGTGARPSYDRKRV